MGQHDAFWSAGGPGGVLDHRDRIQGRCKSASRRKVFSVQGAVNLNHRSTLTSELIKQCAHATGETWRRQERRRRGVLYQLVQTQRCPVYP